MKIINLTPHEITLLSIDGQETAVPPSAPTCRVSSAVGRRLLDLEAPCELFAAPIMGAVDGLPAPTPDTIYVVSTMVASAPGCIGREDVFSPGTGPQDGPRRNEKGQITGVTRLIQAPLR